VELCLDRSKRRHRWSRPAILVLMVLGVTAGHMTVPVTQQVPHDLFVRLYYLPIALGGTWFGLWGGLGTAGLITLVYLPHILVVQHGPLTFGYLLEIPVFLGVGLLTGLIVDRQARYRRGLEGQAETLARSPPRTPGADAAPAGKRDPAPSCGSALRPRTAIGGSGARDSGTLSGAIKGQSRFWKKTTRPATLRLSSTPSP